MRWSGDETKLAPYHPTHTTGSDSGRIAKFHQFAAAIGPLFWPLCHEPSGARFVEIGAAGPEICVNL